MKKVLQIPHDAVGTFRSRPNRFLALVEIEDGGSGVRAHVRDPGRMRELLYPGNRVLLKRRSEPGRSTGWEVLAAMDSREWVLINTGYHRAISEAVLRDPDMSPFGGMDAIRAEVKVGHSRLDFMLEKAGDRIALEVKGCSLEMGGVALFPDAPTERGSRHMRTLEGIAKSGRRAAVMFLVFRPNAKCFTPHVDTDPKFARAFRETLSAGVDFHALKFRYDGRWISYLGEIPVCGNII